jgi:PhzF family phenazine biosynthesis protein
MKIRMFQVDAFTQKLFGGNPAAVCILEHWVDEQLMQSIAAENNLAETAYVVKNATGYDIRWFTPAVEVDLCGHATLAAAHVLFNHLGVAQNELLFTSPRSGLLKIRKTGPLLTLDFPTDVIEKINTPADLSNGLGVQPIDVYKGKTDYMAVLATEEEVQRLRPHFGLLSMLKARGIIVTARGNKSDFVSRFFAPQSGINEDPVTGSAHTSLTPYWAGVLGKKEMTAIQLSPRMGHLTCKHAGDRVEISGHAVTYMEGIIEV